MYFEKEHILKLDDYEYYCILNKTLTPVEYISINQLYIRNEWGGAKAIVNKEYQDGYLTILAIYIYSDDYEEIIHKTINHTPEMLKKLMDKEIDMRNKINNFIQNLKMRGHIDIKTKEDLYEINSYEEEFINQIDSKFPVSIKVSLEDCREKMIYEYKSLMDFNPEMWGCLQYRGDIVFRRFRFILDKNGDPIKLSDFE